jgi:hypothetical protein
LDGSGDHTAAGAERRQGVELHPAALVVSGLSAVHRAYLAGGGYGFLIGDGRLRYGAEVLGEVFYRAALTGQVSLGGTYQPVFNPAYNRDRGPVHIFTGRVHVAF